MAIAMVARWQELGRAWRASTAIACLAAALSSAGVSSHAEELTVFAAASTTTALEEAVDRFPGESTTVRLVFAASSTLAKQIDHGAPADLFLSANAAWMDYLAERGAIDPASRIDLLGNRLVLIAPADRSLPSSLEPGPVLADALGDGRLAIGDPAHVPAGIYAKAALETLGAWPALAGKTARTANVRAALALVHRGEAAAGIVYRSDVAISDRVRVAGLFPAGSHPPITYPMAVVAGRRSPAVDRLYQFLLGPTARAVFEKHGFSAPSQGG